MFKKYQKEEFNLVTFLDGLDVNLKAKTVGFNHGEGWLTIHLNSELDSQEEIALQTYVTDHDVNAPLSAKLQKEKDFNRFKLRAESKDGILATMASENMARVRSGEWSVAQLMGLTQDSELKAILDDINTLSFEIAYSRIDGLTNPTLSNDVKNSWKQMLYEHFYL